MACTGKGITFYMVAAAPLTPYLIQKTAPPRRLEQSDFGGD